MISHLLSLLTCLQTGSSAVDYFPLAPGLKWTYEENVDGNKTQVVYASGQPVKVGTGLGTPIAISLGGRTTTLYYRIDGNVVMLLGSDPEKPLADPQPMLKLGGVTNKWGYDYLESGEPVNINAQISPTQRRNVLGEKREVLELTIKATIGGGRKPVTQIQHAYYAKGVGLCEWDTEQVLGREKHKTTLILTKFETSPPAK